MLGLILSMALLVDSPTSSGPATLVQQLGSPSFASREEADRELEQLGRRSLPSLRVASHSRDAEIRARSTALVSRIENALILEPTSIPIDFRDVLLSDAIESLNRRSSSRFQLSQLGASTIESSRITAQSKDPLPFWTALDLLCSAGSVHLLRDDPRAQGVCDDSYLLIEGLSEQVVQKSDHGPFRVQLKAVRLDRDTKREPQSRSSSPRDATDAVDLGGPGVSGRSNRLFSLELLVSAEPRLTISRNGPLRLTSASDDRGRSLLQASRASGFQHMAGYFGISSTSVFRLRIDLKSLESSGERIDVLRGIIPIVVATRKPDPLRILLDDSPGKTFRSDQIALTLLEHRIDVNLQTSTIQVALKPLLEARTPELGPGEPLRLRLDPTPQQLEVVDEHGQVMPWFPSSTLYDGSETRLTVTVSSRGLGGRATSLRYHEMLRVETEIPFEFRAIPIP